MAFEYTSNTYNFLLNCHKQKPRERKLYFLLLPKIGTTLLLIQSTSLS